MYIFRKTSKMNKTILIVLVLSLAIASMGLTKDGVWTTKSPMGLGRIVLSSSVVDGKVYAIGGDVGNGGISLMEEYDPATDTWTSKVDMPTARSAFNTSAVNGKIYVLGDSIGGGASPISTVEEYDLYPIVVDFNGDGIVDSADVCLMIDYWGTDEPLYVIGPMPWGDGIVDVQDLIILSGHLFEEFPPVEPGD
jgi:hypothetical protein